MTRSATHRQLGINAQSEWETSSTSTSAYPVGENPSYSADLLSLLDRGMQYARQAHFADASLHFALARAQLGDIANNLSTALDAFIASHTQYWQAQQTLHTASHSFVTAEADQQAQLAHLETVLAGAWDSLKGSSDPQASIRLASQQQMLARPVASQRILNDHTQLPSLDITCFGRFEVYRSGRQLELCANRNGQAILRYLVAHPQHRVTMDVLMEVFWPEDRSEVARHKLHVAVSALRRALNGDCTPAKGAGYLICDGETYQLNPDVPLRIDAEQFEAAYHIGRSRPDQSMVASYRTACALYTGPFLPEDIYSDWSLIRREQLTQIYLEMCDTLATHYLTTNDYQEAAVWAAKILQENRCDETAHRHLIQAYTVSGRRTDAIRQYQRCVDILKTELGITPMPETTALFYAILHGDNTIQRGS